MVNIFVNQHIYVRCNVPGIFHDNLFVLLTQFVRFDTIRQQLWNGCRNRSTPLPFLQSFLMAAMLTLERDPDRKPRKSTQIKMNIIRHVAMALLWNVNPLMTICKINCQNFNLINIARSLYGEIETANHENVFHAW